MNSATHTRYATGAILLHWITALLVIFMIVFGEELMEGAEHDAAVGTFLPSVHVSVGVTILVLTFLRLGWRLGHAPPPYPAGMKAWEVTLAKVTHLLFYVLLIAVPLTGWLAFADWIREEPAMSAVSVFGLFPLPAAPLVGGEVKELHEIGSNAMMVLVILHVLAALKHQFVDGDGVFRRILPH
jgi:cytochrome b561